MNLRPAFPDDARALAELGRNTFCAAFGHLYSEKDLNGFLDEVYSEAAVAEEISGQECIHRLAEDNGTLVAYCKLRAPSWYKDDSDAINPIALGQLYTLPDRIGTGIGATLMDWAIAEARELGHDPI